MAIERSARASLLRSTQAFCQLLATRENCQLGVAFYSDRYPNLPEANQYRECIAKSKAELEQAFAEAQDYFHQQSSQPYAIAMAHGEATEEETRFFQSLGYSPITYQVLQLTSWPAHQTAASDIRFLPARAARTVFRTIIRQSLVVPPDMLDSTVQAWEERMDEASMDMTIVTIGGHPAAVGALYQVGDIGRVLGPFSIPSDNRIHAETIMLSYLVHLAQRLNMKHIVMQCHIDNQTTLQAAQEVGFTKAASTVEFHKQLS